MFFFFLLARHCGADWLFLNSTNVFSLFCFLLNFFPQISICVISFHLQIVSSGFFSHCQCYSIGMKNYTIFKDGCCRSKEKIRIYFKIGRSTNRFVLIGFIYFVFTYVLYICMFPACWFRQRTRGTRHFKWGTCFQYKWLLSGQTDLCMRRCSSFLECVYFGLLYPSLIVDIFIVVCVCVCVCVCVYWSWSGFWFH